MAFEFGTDYLFAPKVQVNEGLSAGSVLEGALLGTRNYLFIVPRDGHSFKAMTDEQTGHTSHHQEISWSKDGKSPVEMVQDMLKDTSMSTVKLEQNLLEFYGEHADRFALEVDSAEKLSITVGFWIFGGMKIRKAGGSSIADDKSINLQPKSARQQWASFYEDKLK